MLLLFMLPRPVLPHRVSRAVHNGQQASAKRERNARRCFHVLIRLPVREQAGRQAGRQAGSVHAPLSCIWMQNSVQSRWDDLTLLLRKSHGFVGPRHVLLHSKAVCVCVCVCEREREAMPGGAQASAKGAHSVFCLYPFSQQLALKK